MAIAACLTGPVLGDLSEGSLTVLALELHLRGTLWTLDHAGAVLRTFGSGAPGGTDGEPPHQQFVRPAALLARWLEDGIVLRPGHPT